MASMGTQAKGRSRTATLLPAGTIVALALTVAGTGGFGAQTAGRVIYMAAVEMKGGAQQDKEPYPETPLPSGPGYAKTPPNATPRPHRTLPDGGKSRPTSGPPGRSWCSKGKR
jgi:hypothetical protein